MHELEGLHLFFDCKQKIQNRVALEGHIVVSTLRWAC
jgi:hypothetical protein